MALVSGGIEARASLRVGPGRLSRGPGRRRGPAKHIRLNTELVKKPKDLLEYVIVHEMIHLLEPTHNERFVELLDFHYPTWREARAELNELPLGAEDWKE